MKKEKTLMILLYLALLIFSLFNATSAQAIRYNTIYRVSRKYLPVADNRALKKERLNVGGYQLEVNDE